ncbi:MAG: flagellar hook-basal body complex protein FliE [Vulcanibacillus sp.]
MSNEILLLNNINKNQLIDFNNKPKIEEGTDFSSIFKNAINEVITDVNAAEELSKQAAIGNVQDLHDVTIALEKANLGIQLTTQVRNKVVEAYQEVMRMQI